MASFSGPTTVPTACGPAAGAAFAMEYSYLGRNLYRSPIRAVMNAARARVSAGEDVSLLAGGCPHKSFFPATSLSLTLRDGRVTAPQALDDALQYHKGSGLEDLRSQLEAIQRRVHGAGPWGVACSVGCTDAILKTIELLTEPGDEVLVEAYTWSGVLAQCLPRNRRPVAVAMDGGGVVASALDAALAALPRKQRVFYTIPSGQNPTGCTPSTERKRAVYAVCRKHGVVILEDDPYYFLTMPEETPLGEGAMPGADPARLPDSYLRLDVDGRVIRLDSAAKVVAPGLRLGWVSAPRDFLDKFTVLSETSVQFPSGAAQATMLALLGASDFDASLRKTQFEYARRRDVLVGALRSELAAAAEADGQPPLATVDSPTAGMFLWLHQFVADDSRGLMDDMVANGVACIPGACFAPPETQAQDCPFLRLTFASATDDEMKAGAKRVVATLAARRAAAAPAP